MFQRHGVSRDLEMLCGWIGITPVYSGIDGYADGRPGSHRSTFVIRVIEKVDPLGPLKFSREMDDHDWKNGDPDADIFVFADTQALVMCWVEVEVVGCGA
jgi:hypothetical protein